MLSSLKEKIGLRLLKNHKQATKSEPLVSVNEAKMVGVVYNVKSTDQHYLQKVRDYFSERGIEVYALGFVNEKTVEGYSSIYRDDYICKKHLNFWDIPKKESIAKFIGTKFDYLINLDAAGIIPLQAVSIFSNAKTRFGKHFENFPFAHDFMIKGYAESPRELFREIIKYIK